MQERAAAPEEQVHMRADQENALYYAAGCVPFKLLQKYRRKGTEEVAAVVDCFSEKSLERTAVSWHILLNGPKPSTGVDFLR